MNFKLELFKQLLTTIEYRLKFSRVGVSEPGSFDLICSIDVNEIVKLYSDNNSVDEIKYCLSLLRQVDYIDVSNGVINRITPNGYKFILNTLHNIHCIY